MGTIGLTIPATRGKQGDRVFYVVTVPNSVLNNFFTVNMDPPEEKSQRQLDPKHAHEIRDYILESPSDYVLPTLVYAVDQDCPFREWKESGDVGLLTIPFGTNLRSLDGQHRRQGLNEAIAENPVIAQDSTSVLIYVEPDVDKRRQMFSDMNATPKVVSKALNVYFDRRSPFARAAQTLAETHSLLAGNVDMQATRISAGSEKWFSLGTVFDILKRLQVGPNGRVRMEHRFLEEGIQDRGAQFFNLLAAGRDEFDRVSSGALDLTVLRQKNILFSGTTLRAIAGAVYLLIEHDGESDLSRYIPGLAAIDFRPQADIWRKAGFVSPGRTTPNARNQEVLAATRAIAVAMQRPRDGSEGT